MARSSLAKRLSAVLVLAAWWLTACAQTAPSGLAPGSQGEERAILSAIRAYYENNAVEENNRCSAPLLSAVTRSEVVSRDGNDLVVELGYKYANYTNRGGSRCRGFGNRTFTLTRDGGRFRVIEMTGERRTSPSWRIW